MVAAAGAKAAAASTSIAGRAATAPSGDPAGSPSTTTAGQGGANAGSGNPAGALGAAAGSGAAGTNTGAGATADAGSAGSAGASAGNSSEETTAGVTPVLRIPLRIHTAPSELSELSESELRPILQELNHVWLQQAGICFEIEVTERDENRADGFDFRYTAGQIPIARGSNGVYQDPHTIWSVDHPRLNDVTTPVMHPAARSTGHELGHALGFAHETPPPSNDCSRPCHRVELGDDCDEYLMRSGSEGYLLSEPEVDTARSRAPRFALSDTAETRCAEPMFMP